MIVPQTIFINAGSLPEWSIGLHQYCPCCHCWFATFIIIWHDLSRCSISSCIIISFSAALVIWISFFWPWKLSTDSIASLLLPYDFWMIFVLAIQYELRKHSMSIWRLTLHVFLFQYVNPHQYQLCPGNAHATILFHTYWFCLPPLLQDYRWPMDSIFQASSMSIPALSSLPPIPCCSITLLL